MGTYPYLSILTNHHEFRLSGSLAFSQAFSKFSWNRLVVKQSSTPSPTKKISPGVIPNSVWVTMQAKKICMRVFFQTLIGAQTARTAYNSTIQAISHSFMSIPIVTRRHTTGSKGKPVAWAQECLATHVKSPKPTQRQ